MSCHLFILSWLSAENASHLGKYCQLLLWDLLAVTSNMYLLPGLRLKGLRLSEGEEIPEKMERERTMTKGRDTGLKTGIVCLRVSSISYLWMCRTQKGLYLPGLGINRARLAPGSKQTAWNLPDYSPRLHGILAQALDPLLDWRIHHHRLRTSRCYKQPSTLTDSEQTCAVPVGLPAEIPGSPSSALIKGTSKSKSVTESVLSYTQKISKDHTYVNATRH